jgi:hypothetical protein
MLSALSFSEMEPLEMGRDFQTDRAPLIQYPYYFAGQLGEMENER